MSLFSNRRQAGRVLAAALGRYAQRPEIIVLGLPRGGVPVAYEVARALRAPLDVFVVRKLGVPGHEELAMGALAAGGVCVVNHDVVRNLGLTREDLRDAVLTESRELTRRVRVYRGDRAPLDVSGRTVVLVDDGLATGSTMRAAIKALRRRSPSRVVAAVPLADPETCSELSDEADDMVCAQTPEPFYSVGSWYEDFAQTSDEQVRALLDTARRELRPRGIPALNDRSRALAGASDAERR
jgi:putative phosphoribosyl transferase